MFVLLSRPPPIARTHNQTSAPWPFQPPRFLLARAQIQALAGNDDQLGGSNEQPKKPAKLMSAFERAAAYKKSIGKANPPSADKDSPEEGKPSSSSTDLQLSVPEAEDVLLDFKSLKSKQESEMASALAAKAESRKAGVGQDDSSQGIEVEITTRDGIIRRKVSKPGNYSSKMKGPTRTGISSSDFLGLDFSEKKSTGKGARPAGLSAGFEPPPPGSLPQVEIITRDGKTQQSSKDGLYKPKVATWGIFERPADISQTYGGGRTIKPGEQLETEEEKQARNARTKELLAAYYKKVGLDVDPQIKAECTKTLKKGSDLFEKGYLQGAVEQFEKVMQQMPYQSELHGLAALELAVCLDSSNRFEEAKALYEKLASHPSFRIRKKAKQFLYGFQAMDNLKVSPTSEWDASVYRQYFNALSGGYNTTYKPSEEELDEGRMKEQAIVYLGLVLFPLVLVLLVVALKGR